MKVLIDSGPLTTGDSIRGIGVYTKELINAINKRKTRRFDLISGDANTEKLSKYGLIHFTKFKPFAVSLPFSKPTNTKFVLTIYDLIPLIYPRHYPSGVKGWVRWQINKFLIKKNVDAIITISVTSKKDICRFIGIAPDRVVVTYLAPRELFHKIKNSSVLYGAKLKYKLPKKFALYVGDVNYNKNIPNLLKACKIAGIPLVIAGKQALEIEKMDIHHAELKHLLGLDWSNTTRLGYVSDEDLVKIYNSASVYIQPSFYEGFGLPLLEAYTCGTPIAVSKNQCHVEILGKEFDYFDPNDPGDIAKAIINPNKDKKPIREYSWEETSKETLKIYEEI